MFKVNIPELLESNRPFAELFMKFLCKAGEVKGTDNAVEAVFPDGADKSVALIKFSMNGIDIPQDMFMDIFFKYSEYYAEEIVRGEVQKRFEEMESVMEETTEMIKALQTKMCEDFGLELSDYETY